MFIKNLTPNRICLDLLFSDTFWLEPSESPAIVSWHVRQIGSRHIQFGRPHECLQVPIHSETPIAENVPDPEPGIILLVDYHVFQAVKRSDVFTYSDEKEDGQGNVLIQHLIGHDIEE